MKLMEAKIKLADNINYAMIQKIGEIFEILRDVNREGKYGADIPYNFHVRNWSIEQEGTVEVYIAYYSDQRTDFFGLPIELFSIQAADTRDEDITQLMVCPLKEACTKWLEEYSIVFKKQKVEKLKKEAESLGYVLVVPA